MHPQEASLQDLKGLLQKAIVECGLKGMSTAVLFKGKLIFAEGFGDRNEAKDPFLPETLMPIASLTKAFTAAAIGELVAEDKMDWDTTPVSQYLPEFQLKDPILTSQLTMVDLLSHRTGLPDLDFAWMKSEEPRRDLIKRLRHVDMPSKLGCMAEYNNIMYAVAGEAAANVAGVSYEELVQTKVIDQLGLKNSGFGPINMTKHSSNYAMPFDADSFEDAQNGLFVAGELEEIYMTDAPAGDMFSNVLDLVQWGRTIIQEGRIDEKQVLDKDSVNELLMGHSIMTRERRTSDFAPVLTYGLGWILDSYKGQTVYRHTGSNPGFFSNLALFPDVDLVVACCSNTENAELLQNIPYHIADELLSFHKTEDWLFEISIKEQKERYEEWAKEAEGDLPERIKNTPASHHALNALVGEYTDPVFGDICIRLERDDKTLGENEGSLFIKMRSLDGKLEHYHYDSFSVFWEEFGVKTRVLLNFHTGQDGKVTGFLLELEGQSIVFERTA